MIVATFFVWLKIRLSARKVTTKKKHIKVKVKVYHNLAMKLQVGYFATYGSFVILLDIL